MVKNKKGVKGKKGQVFLVAAIILGLALVSVTVKHNTAREYPLITDYEELSQNYLTEAPKIINYARYHEEIDEKEALQDFTEVYLKAAQERDPNFGIFYTFRDSEGTIHIVNTLNNRILKIRVISGQDITQEVLSYGKIQAPGTVCVAGSCNTIDVGLENFGGQYSGDIELRTIEEGTVLQVCVNEEDCVYLGGALNILTNTEEPIIDLPIGFIESTTVEFTLEEY